MESNEATDPARPDAPEEAPQQPQHPQQHHQPPRPAYFAEAQQPHQQPETQQPETQQPGTEQPGTEQHRQPEPAPAPLSADPGMPERFRGVVRALDEIEARPVADHAEAYDAVHRDLRTVLDDVDRSS